MIKVILTGAAGRMGKAAIKALHSASDFQLVAALTRQTGLGHDAGSWAGLPSPLGMPLQSDVAAALKQADPGTTLLDLSQGEAAYQHACLALEKSLPVVIGATGLSEAQIEDLSQRARQARTGVLLAPNFSVGALLLMRFAEQASQYFDWAEIIELHHEKKLDAPSGTARKTAQLMHRANPHFQAATPDSPARGELVEGIPVHAVRLPGLLAHQEVIFGSPGQTLTLRHDTLDRDSFMPGVLLALQKVQGLQELVYGLEKLI